VLYSEHMCIAKCFLTHSSSGPWCVQQWPWKTHGLSVTNALLQRHKSGFREHFCGISLAF